MPGQKVRRAAPQGMQPQGGSCSRLKFAPSRATQRALTPFCRRGSKNLASTQTSNYQLNLWEPGDHFLREEFNENSVKVDGALGELAAVMPRLYGNSYTGNGTSSRTISFPFPPQLVLITAGDQIGDFCAIVRGQTTGQNTNNAGFSISWSGSGMTLTSSNGSQYGCSNRSGVVYHYFGIG